MYNIYKNKIICRKETMYIYEQFQLKSFRQHADKVKKGGN